METLQSEPNHAETRGNGQVLIVDDDPDCLHILEAYMRNEGFRTICATDGYEALGLLMTGIFSFMITDYNMPILDGLKLCREARKIDPELVMIMISGSTTHALVAEAVRLGVSAVLAKPLNATELVTQVRKLVL